MIVDIRNAFKARRFFPNAPRHQRAKQALAWAKAVAFLGDKWLLYAPLKR